jgi:hypothetical protein
MTGLKWTFALLTMALAAAASAGEATTAAGNAGTVREKVQQKQQQFSWNGNCSVKCMDGQCRLVCGSGLVYANSSFEARLQAEATLRSMASAQGGQVVEGSFTIMITIR